MTKDDIKNYLLEKGASITLIQMPAVMERIYSYFDTMPESTYSGYSGTVHQMQGILPRELGRILKVSSNGGITINYGKDKRAFEERENGEAAYINNDEGMMSIDEEGEYLIDKYGMDKGFKGNFRINIVRTDEGTIQSGRHLCEDDGSPIINVAYYSENGVKRDDEEVNDFWNKNREQLTKEYPQTREWFDVRDTQRKMRLDYSDEIKPEEKDDQIKIIEDENKTLKSKMEELKAQAKTSEETIEYLQNKDEENEKTIVTLRNSNEEKEAEINSLQQENAEKDERIRDLQVRNSNLQERNSNLQAMLAKALEKCEQVKTSIFGRFFFTKEERKEAKKQKQLTDGKGNNIER